MRAVFERDFLGEVRSRRFFLHRALAAGGPALTLLWVSNRGSSTAAGADILRGTSLAATLAVLLLVPGVFAPLLARERASHALDVLRSAPLSPAGLVLGVWGARTAAALLLVFAASAVISLALLFGGATTTQLGCVIALLVVMTAWLGAASLLIGALVRDVTAAMRLAYVVPVLACGAPVLGDTLVDAGATAVGVTLSSLSPLRAVASVWVAGVPVATQLLLHLGLGASIVAIALACAIRAVGREPTTRRRGSPRAARGLTRLVAPILQRRPVLWLGISRGASTLSSRLSLLLAILVIVAEAAFASRVHRVCAEAGETIFSASPFTRAALTQLHVAYIAATLVLALLVGVVAGATVFQRESESNTLEVFFATPLTNTGIVRGLLVSAIVTAAPLWLIAVLHLAVAAASGAISVACAVSVAVCSAVGLAHASGRAFLHGMDKSSATGAVFAGLKGQLLAEPPRRRPPGCVTILAFFLVTITSVWLLRSVFTAWALYIAAAHPVFYALSGLAVPHARLGEDALLHGGLLLLLPIQLRRLQRLVDLFLPRRFMKRRDQQYRALRHFEDDPDERRDRGGLGVT